MATKILRIKTPGQGLHEITDPVAATVREAACTEALCTIFIRHTSASLIIQENADPSARRDLEAWFSRLVPEGDGIFTHIAEGADDMPSHVKAVLTSTSLSIPVFGGHLVLGTWQGIYVWEHRNASHLREVVVHIA